MSAARTDLVILSLEAWDDVWRRNQYLVTGLLARDPGMRVLFVEPPADPLYEFRQRRAPTTGGGLRLVEDSAVSGQRLWALHPTKWLPRSAGPAADRLLGRQVRRAAGALGFTRPLLWINDPAAAGLLAQTGWPALYDITDDWLHASQGPRGRRRIEDNERALLAGARAVVVCSPDLARNKHTSSALHVIPNAVDIDLFRAPAARPSDLPSGRIALYAGTLHTDRIDVDLCVRTAERVATDGRLVLLGPDLLSEEIRRQLDHAGVVRLGPRPYRDVPGYLQHADALVVPHVVTAFTESLDPIKRYEYQVLGRPVVATPVAGFRDLASASVVTGEGFAAAVAALLRSAPLPPGPLPVEQAMPSWADRVAAMATVLTSVRGAEAASG